VKYRWPIGIELTAIHKEYREKYHGGRIRRASGSRVVKYPNDALLEPVIPFIKKAMKRQNLQCTDVMIDDHCIEIPSKKLYSLAQTAAWSIAMRKIFASHDCFPKHPETVDGGAHIHVGIKDVQFKIEVFKDLIMRPYLPWVFGDPDEAFAMDNFIHRKDLVDGFLHHREIIKNDGFHGHNEIENYSSLGAGLMHLWYTPNAYMKPCVAKSFNYKDYMARLSGMGTLEFRFFEMTETWEEQELQIKFLMAYLEWMWKRFLKEKKDVLEYPERKLSLTNVSIHEPDYLKKIKKEEAAGQFNNFCRTIGVDHVTYKPFVERNLYPRWELGRQRR
jgi:hypothetical protein